MKEIDNQLDEIFRQNFFYYVLGKTEGKEEKVQTVIKTWMDTYNLWNFGFDVDQLRQHFYRMKDKGGVTWLQTRDMSHTKVNAKR